MAQKESSMKSEHCILLIREDLKGQKVFDNLKEIGLEDISYQPDLADIILTEAGLNPDSEKDQYLYYCLVKEYAPRVTANRRELDELAGEVLSRLWLKS